MTVSALKTLRTKSPNAIIGVIIPPNKPLSGIQDQITVALKNDVKNIIFKAGKLHFDNWNPTQVLKLVL
jgi:hypothetical protein